ncbi:MAG: topoisomerase DNA-binding C4 zinc finger domain-containing protein [Dehalogenimonas sp.]|uniref:Phospholipase D-like domain-containing protein n=1 Tax=Candidatus Dehalogenimonas loeffleri TaxID=3127115 RepID=A0ABZ2J843_9CHLR|nr:topoisomerase DNA-binding C4 zinc finger domain-containing protein [Dehalogenimonas sp.]
MAEFLATKGVAHYIDNIIVHARQKLFIVSPYLKLSKYFTERIVEANNRAVNIYVIYGKKELTPSEKQFLSQLKYVKVYYCKELHAKCYGNEQMMLISSMNLHEYSENNNREMGISITLERDKQLYEQILEEIKSIVGISKQHVNSAELLKEFTIEIDSPKVSEPSISYPKMVCPKCGKDLVQRTANKGQRAGQVFMGCSGYPSCRYSISTH